MAWDYTLRPPSRLSMMVHVRQRRMSPYIRALKLPARVLSAVGAERPFENLLDKLLLTYPRSLEGMQKLESDPPNVLVTTGPHRFEEPALVACAKSLGIAVLALIHSWDNLSTKNRMIFKHDGYLVWSEQMKRDLHHFYPWSQELPVYVVGAPQFDVFFQERFKQTRDEFCAEQGLDPQKPIILYALGSPNFLSEHHGALYMAERVARGELGDAQLLIRPHPLFDNGEHRNQLLGFGERIHIQQTGDAGASAIDRFQDDRQVREWVNSFRHSNVVINLSSTVTIDAAICDCPVVNLDFDPAPGQPNQALVKDVNHVWTHFKPIAESGGVWLVRDFDEMIEAVKTYLERPEMHREKRRWIAEYVCGYLDGRSGERMAAAVLDFVAKRQKRTNTNV
jgi:hypothetical protein